MKPATRARLRWLCLYRHMRLLAALPRGSEAVEADSRNTDDVDTREWCAALYAASRACRAFDLLTFPLWMRQQFHRDGVLPLRK